MKSYVQIWQRKHLWCHFRNTLYLDNEESHVKHKVLSVIKQTERIFGQKLVPKVVFLCSPQIVLAREINNLNSVVKIWNSKNEESFQKPRWVCQLSEGPNWPPTPGGQLQHRWGHLFWSQYSLLHHATAQALHFSTIYWSGCARLLCSWNVLPPNSLHPYKLHPVEGDVVEHLGHAGEVWEQVQEWANEGYCRGGVQGSLWSLFASRALDASRSRDC